MLCDDGHYVTTEPSLRGLVIALATWPLQQQGTPMIARSREEDLNELLRLYSLQQLKVVVDETFPLEAATRAHQKIENESFCGKLALRVPEETIPPV